MGTGDRQRGPLPCHEPSGIDPDALSLAKVWVGLANSDDVGIPFDLHAIVSVNGSPVGSVSGQRGGRIERLEQREAELAVISQDVVPERSGLE